MFCGTTGSDTAAGPNDTLRGCNAMKIPRGGSCAGLRQSNLQIIFLSVNINCSLTHSLLSSIKVQQNLVSGPNVKPSLSQMLIETGHRKRII